MRGYLMATSTTNEMPGLTFTETMTGFFVRNPLADFKTLEARIPEGAHSFEFTLTIHSNDLADLLKNPKHEASISGSVVAPELSQGRLTVSEGAFNLFVKNPEEVETQTMRYRFRMNGADGGQFYLDGIKIIKDASLLHVWHDTTTLYFTLYQGADGAGPAVGRGILHIKPQEFLKQLTTMRVTNAAGTSEELKGLAEFGAFFAGTLYRHYGGIFAGLTAFNPKAPPRLK